MLIWIVIVVALSAAAGVPLIVLGLRGRALGANPICRRCGFDLSGRFPWSQPTCPTCSDCGELLLTHASVMHGARARRTSLIALGCTLCFPGLILALATLADTVAGGATAAIKPTPLIAAQVSANTKSSPALRTLTSRVSSGAVQRGDILPAIERALVLQADRSVNLESDWLDLLENARRRGLMTPPQLERYFKGAFDWRLLTRPLAPSAPVTFAVQGFADRLGASATPLVITVSFVRGSVSEAPLLLPGMSTPFDTLPVTAALTPNALFELVDSAAPSKTIRGGDALKASLKIQVQSGSETGQVLAAWEQNLITPVQPAGEWPANGSPAAGADLVSRLGIDTITLERDDTSSGGGSCWASFSIKPGTLPADVVATLRITTDNQLTYESLGTVTITPSDPRWALLTAADPTRSPWKVRVPMNGVPGGTHAAVELVPLQGVARSSTLAWPVWNGRPLRRENVELKWLEAAPAKP